MKISKKIYGWSVHLLTSLGAILSVIAIIFAIEAAKSTVNGQIYLYDYYMQLSMLMMILAIFIDSIDGSLARIINIKDLAPLDGKLLDNIIDFANYCIVPCIWIYVSGVVSKEFVIPIITMITISSSYQFCQLNAKTNNNFFVGFPSYWNIIIIYMLCFQSDQLINQSIIIILCIFSFIPIKYIYLSRAENISNNKFIKIFTFYFTMLAAISTILSVFRYPEKAPSYLMYIIIMFIIFYMIFSLIINIKYKKN